MNMLKASCGLGLRPFSSGQICRQRGAVGSRPIPCSRPIASTTNRRMGVLVAAQQPDVAAAPPPVDPVKQRELVKGCRTVLAELKGLDMGRNEVKLYLAAATKAPRTFKGGADVDMARARANLEKLLATDEDGDPLPATRFEDLQGLDLTQAMLNDLWRWRRRGGGMENDEEGVRPHEAALRDIQNFKPEDIDRVTSSVLDNLDMSDEQKKEMSGGMQTLAVGAFQGAVWGSLGLALAFVVIFNFIRGG